MTPLIITAAIFWTLAITASLLMIRKSRIDAGMHPRRGEGCGQCARQDRGEGGEFRTIHNEGISS